MHAQTSSSGLAFRQVLGKDILHLPLDDSGVTECALFCVFLANRARCDVFKRGTSIIASALLFGDTAVAATAECRTA